MTERPVLNPRERMALPRTAMPARGASIRARDFQEVNLGFTQVLAAAEAERCLQCPLRPCVEGCPVGVDIPEFIKALREGDMAEAAKISVYTWCRARLS